MITPLNELKKYKNNIINLIYGSQEIIGLLADQQKIDLSSKEAEAICDNNIMDFLYVPDTQLQERALVGIEIEMSKRNTSTCKQLNIIVQIICHKDYMKLSNWKGIIGNRRDNLACSLSNLIDGNRNLGIGKALLQRAYPSSAPAQYTAFTLEFISDGFVLGDSHGC